RAAPREVALRLRAVRERGLGRARRARRRHAPRVGALGRARPRDLARAGAARRDRDRAHASARQGPASVLRGRRPRAPARRPRLYAHTDRSLGRASGRRDPAGGTGRGGVRAARVPAMTTRARAGWIAIWAIVTVLFALTA